MLKSANLCYNEAIMKYLQMAKKFHEAAKKEFAAGKSSQDEILIRQAAGKGWGAAVQATNALLVKKHIKVPRGTGRREELLFSVQEKDSKLKELKLGESYSHFLRTLHSECFYDGDVSIKRVDRDLRKAGEYIHSISTLVNGRS